MTALMYLLGIVLFVLGMPPRSPARARATWSRPGFGMKVTQFFVGFGRTVWSRHQGETEFGIKAIPLGGYVDHRDDPAGPARTRPGREPQAPARSPV